MWTLVALAAEEAPLAVEAGGISAIGLDVRALIWQVVNFAILLWLLKKFAYKPIMSILSQRQAVIEESLRTAAEVEEAKKKTEGQRHQIIKQAEGQAHKIMQQSKQQATALKSAAEEEAQSRADQIIKQGKSKIEQEVSIARQQIKGELGSLVVAATEKIIDVKLDEKKDAELLARALQEAAARIS